MLIKESFILALNAIKSNKMRSFLTMLGIIIGISSVIAISAIGHSIKSELNEAFENIGTNAVYMYGNWEDEEGKDVYFEDEDKKDLREKFKKKIDYIDTNLGEDQELHFGNNIVSVYMEGIDSGYLKVNPTIKIIKGRMISDKDIEQKKKRDCHRKKTCFKGRGQYRCDRRRIYRKNRRYPAKTHNSRSIREQRIRICKKTRRRKYTNALFAASKSFYELRGIRLYAVLYK